MKPIEGSKAIKYDDDDDDDDDESLEQKKESYKLFDEQLDDIVEKLTTKT